MRPRGGRAGTSRPAHHSSLVSARRVMASNGASHRGMHYRAQRLSERLALVALSTSAIVAFACGWFASDYDLLKRIYFGGVCVNGRDRRAALGVDLRLEGRDEVAREHGAVESARGNAGTSGRGDETRRRSVARRNARLGRRRLFDDAIASRGRRRDCY